MACRFKKILISAISALCIIPMSACVQTITVKSVSKTSSDGLVDTYTIVYSDGSTFSFQVSNGKDGKDGRDGTDFSVAEFYAEAVNNGYSGSYLDFVDVYFGAQSGSSSTLSVNKALMSVVSVYAEFPMIQTEYYYQQSPFGGLGISKREVKTLGASAGSGVIYKSDNENEFVYIVTNYHVVYNSESTTEDGIGKKIAVYAYGTTANPVYATDKNGNNLTDKDGYPYIDYGDSAIECEYIGGSLTYDIAVLRAKISDFENVDFSVATVSKDVTVSEKVVAIGNPQAGGISVTSGIVSVDSEYISMTGADNKTQITCRVIRTDTAINSGNSGGGLFNAKGELVGIVNAKSVADEVENIAYAIPSSVVCGVADNIIKNSASGSKKMTGVVTGATFVAENSHAYFDLDKGTIVIKETVIVDSLDKNGLAERMGLKEGDIIGVMYLNDELINVHRIYNIIDAMLYADVSDKLSFEIIRDGECATGFEITLTAEDFIDID